MDTKALNPSAIKGEDLVNYLAHLGFTPQKISGDDYWYLSPLRQEHTPSFKVNRRLNCWYDHGLGAGGTLIDFGIRYFHCSFSEFLSLFTEHHSSGVQRSTPAPAPEQRGEKTIAILGETKTLSFGLQRYLRSRCIPPLLALRWCSEVTFALGDKQYRALGFKNEKGGYELRNPWFKGSASPKGCTYIQKGAREIAVFEGFFDFLSYLTITHQQKGPQTDYLILNSLAFFDTHSKRMESYDSARLFLDLDTAGMACTQKALEKNSCYRDESHLYRGYADLNDWHRHMGKGPGCKKQCLH